MAGACPTTRPATCSPGASRPASATGAASTRRPTTASPARGRGSVPPDSGSLAARVAAAGRRCSPACPPRDGWGTRGTPRQAGYLAERPGAERAGARPGGADAREVRPAAGQDARRPRLGVGRLARPPRARRLPSPSLPGRHEDVVPVGDVGTGKTHMPGAPCAPCRRTMRQARLLAASSLVMRPGRARGGGSPDREPARLARAEPPGTDELGFLPLDVDGARLPFQAVSESYERQSLVTATNPGSGRWGTVFGDDQMAAAAVDRVCHHGRLLRLGGESRHARHAPVSGKGAARRQRETARGMASRPGAPVATSLPSVTPDARCVTCPTTPCPRQGATDSPVTGQSTRGWGRCAVTAPMRRGSSGARPSPDRMASPRGHRTGGPPVSVGRPGREAPDLGDRRPDPVRTLPESWCDFCSI